MTRFTAIVPATSANLGPGFDCLGLALQMQSEFTVDLDGPPGIVIEGEGSDSLPRDERNLVHKSIRSFLDRQGKPTPDFALHIVNRIPLSGGLGSSSAALVAAIMLGNAIGGANLSVGQILDIAADLEGHPDNVAPALLGGLVVSAATGDGSVTALRMPVPPSLSAVLFIPEFSVRTKRARQVLPRYVPHRDASFNVGRAALLLAALANNRLDALRSAMQDRLHQPYRSRLFPAMGAIFEGALAAGAEGACLSGSGSAILALTARNHGEIGNAMHRAAVARGVDGRWMHVGIALVGAELITR